MWRVTREADEKKATEPQERRVTRDTVLRMNQKRQYTSIEDDMSPVAMIFNHFFRTGLEMHRSPYFHTFL